MRRGNLIGKLCAVLALGIIALGAREASATPIVPAIVTDGTIAQSGQIDYIYFSVCEAGTVVLNVRAFEYDPLADT